jgi:hypothetical protein
MAMVGEYATPISATIKSIVHAPRCQTGDAITHRVILNRIRPA